MSPLLAVLADPGPWVVAGGVRYALAAVSVATGMAMGVLFSSGVEQLSSAVEDRAAADVFCGGRAIGRYSPKDGRDLLNGAIGAFCADNCGSVQRTLGVRQNAKEKTVIGFLGLVQRQVAVRSNASMISSSGGSAAAAVNAWEQPKCVDLPGDELAAIAICSSVWAVPASVYQEVILVIVVKLNDAGLGLNVAERTGVPIPGSTEPSSSNRRALLASRDAGEDSPRV